MSQFKNPHKHKTEPSISLSSKFDYQPPRAMYKSICKPNTGKEYNTIHFADGNTVHFKSEESK